jgi:hypothetical protein
VTPCSSSTSGQRAKQAGRTGSNGFSTKARPNIHAQRAERRGAAGGGFLLGLLGLGHEALGVLNPKTAVDGRKTPQVAVEIEQFWAAVAHRFGTAPQSRESPGKPCQYSICAVWQP